MEIEFPNPSSSPSSSTILLLHNNVVSSVQMNSQQLASINTYYCLARMHPLNRLLRRNVSKCYGTQDYSPAPIPVSVYADYYALIDRPLEIRIMPSINTYVTLRNVVNRCATTSYPTDSLFTGGKRRSYALC